ncbi:ribonuclease domain-containing protein, partial [Cupriavidus sp. 2MCAB6]|uniref:ribonuclease domain-containing protein n=1 Tax=Cupriavidus sp. 2MCAB6 TaxID=3232981 RepID=UPI003F8EEC9A
SAALAAQNESLNNATSQGPARGIAARENARLTAQCGAACRQEDFQRIDTQVRQVEAAATLARMNNLTPEQALKLGDMLTSLLPLYGTPAALYQAVTGQGLSGQPLGTAERWLMGIAGVLPVAGVAYSKLSEFVAARGAVATNSAVVRTEGTANASTYAGLKLDLKTTQAANDVVDSLRATGQLPGNYVTKAEAAQHGWQPGRALNNSVAGGQLGGDVFANSTNVLPSASGRIWYEADIGLSNTMSRSNQLGTRLLYSSDGLLYITADHYKTVTKIGNWK